MVNTAFAVATAAGLCIVCGFVTNELKQTIRGLVDEIDKLQKSLRQVTKNTEQKEQLIADCVAKTERLVANNMANTEKLIAKNEANTEQLIANNMANTYQHIADSVARTEQLATKNMTAIEQLTEGCVAQVLEMTKRAGDTADAVNMLPNIIDATAKKYSMYLHDEHEKIVELMSGSG